MCLAEFADIYGIHLELRFFNLAQVGFEPTSRVYRAHALNTELSFRSMRRA